MLLLGILTSGVCINADDAALAYAREGFGQNSHAFQLTRYYLAGNGPNPALKHLSAAEVQIADAIQWVRHYGDMLAKTCPDWALPQESATVANLQTVQYS